MNIFECPRLTLHQRGLTDSASRTRTIQQVQPDESYNLSATSHVAVSLDEPEYTASADDVGTLRILGTTRMLGLKEKTTHLDLRSPAVFSSLTQHGLKPAHGHCARSWSRAVGSALDAHLTASVGNAAQ